MSFSQEQALSRLGTGCVLVARSVLRDPNFQGTVVLLCAHEDDGDYGLVLNRVSRMPLEEVFESLPPELRGPAKVHIGGPVEQDKVQILDWSDEPAREAQSIVPGIAMGGHWNFRWDEDDEFSPDDPDSGKRFHKADPSRYRIFLGYSGWGRGQLAGEIELGAWAVHQVDLAALLSAAPDHLPVDEDAFESWATAHPSRDTEV